MTDALTTKPLRPWLRPLAFAITAVPAGQAGGHGLFKIVAFIAHHQGCEICFRSTDATPTFWSLMGGIALLVLAAAWLVLLGHFVFVAFRRRTQSLAHAALAVALLGLFYWASR